MEQLDYNLLYRWFVGLSMDGTVWNHSVFYKNRDRLLNTGNRLKIEGIQGSTEGTVTDIKQIEKVIDDINEIVNTIASGVEE